MGEAGSDLSLTFIELGPAVIGLALLAHLASRRGVSAIPLYLLAAPGFGEGGLLPLDFSQDFIQVGAEIGVLLLLFMPGLEYTASEPRDNLRKGLSAGFLDFLLNFPPGLLCGYLLGWGLLESLLLGGVTYISSSGIIASVLGEIGRLDKPETPAIPSVLAIEDLAMAVYLPLIAVLLPGRGWTAIRVPVLIALATAGFVLFMAVRRGEYISRVISRESSEIIRLTTFGMILLAAGIAQQLQVSAAIGAFLVGIAISGPIAERAHPQISPLRDLLAAIFFFFFGLKIDPATLPPVLLIAAGLGLVTALTKLLTGWLAARTAGISRAGQLLAGRALVARGDFSIVIAGLNPKPGPLATAYVLLSAILGPFLTRTAFDWNRHQP